MVEQFITEAKHLESAGAVAMTYSTNLGLVVDPAVVEAVTIPVLGGFRGGQWLDGRIRMSTAALGYPAKWLDAEPTAYANVAHRL